MPEIRLRDVSFGLLAVAQPLTGWDDELGFVPKDGSTVEASDFVSASWHFRVSGARRDRGWLCGTAALEASFRRGQAAVCVPCRSSARGWASPAFWGRGRAAGQGCEELRLDTGDGVPAALAAFRFASFPPIDDYNGDPYARRLRAELVDDLRANDAMHMRPSVMRREYL